MGGKQGRGAHRATKFAAWVLPPPCSTLRRVGEGGSSPCDTKRAAPQCARARARVRVRACACARVRVRVCACGGGSVAPCRVLEVVVCHAAPRGWARVRSAVSLVAWMAARHMPRECRGRMALVRVDSAHSRGNPAKMTVWKVDHGGSCSRDMRVARARRRCGRRGTGTQLRHPLCYG